MQIVTHPPTHTLPEHTMHHSDNELSAVLYLHKHHTWRSWGAKLPTDLCKQTSKILNQYILSARSIQNDTMHWLFMLLFFLTSFHCGVFSTDDGLQNGPGQHRNTQGNPTSLKWCISTVLVLSLNFSSWTLASYSSLYGRLSLSHPLFLIGKKWKNQVS